MSEQLHQRFSTEETKTFLEEYLDDKTKLFYILEILKITRRRFFQLLKEYRENPDNFSIEYKRKRATRKISKDVEKNIISELEKEKKLIENKELPIKFYNYSYIRDRIYQDYGQKVSLPTIIDLPPLIVPLVKLESTELWSREQVPGSSRHCAALLDCTLSATLQSIYLLQSM